jgi:hypothetical protein
VDIIVQTMLTRNVRNAVVMSGSCAVVNLVGGAPDSLSVLSGYRVQLVKDLQRRALLCEQKKDKALRKEEKAHEHDVEIEEPAHPVIRAAEKPERGLRELVGVIGTATLLAGKKTEAEAHEVVDVGDAVVAQFDFKEDGSILLIPKATDAVVFKGDVGMIVELFHDGSNRVEVQFEEIKVVMYPSHFKHKDEEQDMLDWACTLTDILGGHETCGVDENLGDPPTPLESEDESSSSGDEFPIKM